jgi:hypothetical protein
MTLVQNLVPILLHPTQTSHGVRLELNPDLSGKKPEPSRVMALTVVIIV